MHLDKPTEPDVIAGAVVDKHGIIQSYLTPDEMRELEVENFALPLTPSKFIKFRGEWYPVLVRYSPLE
jgi:hypothetical protein